jgi:glycerate-2-kinase
VTLLSGGTDGEDGPTPSAGALADEALVAAVRQRGIIPNDYLRINNAWPFFDQLGGLLNTGVTHTNVMDVQVGLVHP